MRKNTITRAEPSRRLITLMEAAVVAGVHHRTVRNWVSEGRLTGYRLPSGRGLRIDLDELEASIVAIPTVATIQDGGR